jgi:hypothetical protein
MFTLHIEHTISDYATWRTAFDGFAQARAQAGVRAHRIRHPVDDPCHLFIELDFEHKDDAAAFRQFLVDVVWSDPGASPALVGAPTATVLEPVDP